MSESEVLCVGVREERSIYRAIISTGTLDLKTPPPPRPFLPRRPDEAKQV